MINTNLCERCKNAEIVLICEECSPFHNYCQKCDAVIHELSDKQLFKCNYNNKSSPNLLIKQKICEEKINNLINDVKKEISKENEQECINEDNSNNGDNQEIQNEEIPNYNEDTNNENYIYYNNEKIVKNIREESIKKKTKKHKKFRIH